MLARQLISEEILPLLLTDTVSEALHRMDEYKVSHFPVIQDGCFVGLLFEKELIDLPDYHQIIPSENAHFEDLYVESDQLIYHVLSLAVKQKLSLIPVLDAEKRYQGSILPSDLLIFFSQSLSADSPGGVIVLEVSESDYSLTEIANIVESNDAKVLHVLLNNKANNSRLQVIVKVNAMNIGAILKTFERYNYTVDAFFGQDISQEDLKEHYESLMNYLKL
jgi:CBS domain-containing protein